MKQQNAAKYVEASINFRDLCSLFLFERSDDMHIFMSEIRDRQNLVVNTALIPNKSIDDFNPPRSIEELQ